MSTVDAATSSKISEVFRSMLHSLTAISFIFSEVHFEDPYDLLIKEKNDFFYDCMYHCHSKLIGTMSEPTISDDHLNAS
jgi:hypothetical protein